jgi:hypothetical protein
MKWAEVLTVVNTIGWLLPILIRSYIAWKYDNTNRVNLSVEESGQISGAISRLNLGGKVLKISDGTEELGTTEGRNE